MGLFLAEPGSNPSKGVTWCYNRAHYDHVNWHNQLPTAKDILYEIHWYLSQLLLRNGIFFPDRLVKLPILHYDLEIINIHRQGLSSPRHNVWWRKWIREFNKPPLPLQNTPPSATWRNESRWGRTASSLSRYVLKEQGRFEREKQHLYAEFANTLIHFADGIAGQRQTDRQEKRFFGPEGNQGNCRLKAGEEGERGREGKVAIRIPIYGSASHASA